MGAKGNPKRDPAPSPVSLAAQVGWGWGARLSPPRSFTKARSVFYQEEFKGWVSRPKVTRAWPFPAKPVCPVLSRKERLKSVDMKVIKIEVK